MKRIKPIEVATTPMSLGTDYFGIEGPGCAEWVKDSIKKAHEEQVPFVGFTSHPLHSDVVAVPARTIEDWRHRIEGLRREIESHGLKLEAVISHPSPFVSLDKPLTSLAEMDGLFNKPSAGFVMTELQDPDSILNQGLADALDAKELERTVTTRGFGVWPTLTEQEIDIMLTELEESEWGEHGSPMRMVQTKKLQVDKMGTDKCFPYLKEGVYIPSCQIVGKGATDSCKHLIGRLDYCHECEHEHDDPIDLSEESI